MTLLTLAHRAPAMILAASLLLGMALSFETPVTNMADTSGTPPLEADSLTSGRELQVELGSISGRVQERYNGVFAPLPDIIITLVDDERPGSGAIITVIDDFEFPGTFEYFESMIVATTLTDSGGEYSFSDLPFRVYTVVQTDLPGYKSTFDSDDIDSALNGSSATRVTLGETSQYQSSPYNYRNIDFFDARFGSISGKVEEEFGGFAIPAIPLSGVLITLVNDSTNGFGTTLTDDGGYYEFYENMIVATTLTDSNGDYMFSDVVATVYAVVQTDLPGYYSVRDTDGTGGRTGSSSTFVTIGSPGFSFDYTGIDFGDSRLGSISGNVQQDTDSDGVGDEPYPGVNIGLTDESGYLYVVTVSDSDGDYVFSDLWRANYFVIQTGNIGVIDSNGPLVQFERDESQIEVLLFGESIDSTGNDFILEPIAPTPIVLTPAPTPSPTPVPTPYPNSGGPPVYQALSPFFYDNTPGPTPAPTPSPSSGPTPPPTTLPTPTPPPADVNLTLTAVYGDPHFKTWSGEMYDFHAECDLVFIKAPKFDMDINIRTKIRKQFSYVSSAVIRIGEETLEIQERGNGFLNHNHFERNQAGQTIGGYLITHTRPDAQHHTFEIDLGEHGRIMIKTYTVFVFVFVDSKSKDVFEGSRGLNGDFDTGKLLVRDGTEVTDAIAFGEQWQVVDTDPVLFQTVRAPQHPQRCIFPEAAVEKGRRRLTEQDTKLIAAAQYACIHFGENSEDFDACVFDVIATGDIGMADAGVY